MRLSRTGHTATSEERDGNRAPVLQQRHGALWRRVNDLLPRGNRWRGLILALGLVMLVPASAEAQIRVTNYGQQCVSSFLAACATLRYLDFSSTGTNGEGVLTIIVENTSGDDEPGAYIKKLRLDFAGLPPIVEPHMDESYGLADAQYGRIVNGFFIPTEGATETWKAKNEGGDEAKEIPGFQKDFKLDDKAKEEYGGDSGLQLVSGDAVMIQITFASGFDGAALECMNDPECQGWTAEMKGLGDGSGKGYTTTPEPSTWLLLATGLGLMGVAGLRRKRETRQQL